MGKSRKLYIITAASIVFFCCFFIIHYNNLLYKKDITSKEKVKQEKPKPTPEQKQKVSVKKVLYWTPMFQQVDFNLGLGSQIFENCSYKNCEASYAYDKDTIDPEDYDAILFHAIDFVSGIHGKPEKRRPEQVYVYSNQESPTNTPRIITGRYENFFNWTMTYRLDSDLIRPYGIIRKTKTHYQPPTEQQIEKRPKTAAWFVSNCETESRREFLFEKLNEYISIDVYGHCGTLQCSKNDSEQCNRMLESQYKFYLSFENSYCLDYVTEKLFNMLKRDIVPIVYGGADYKKIAPPNSVINVADFKTIEDLARYIQFLDRSPREYLRFFEWKKHYVIDTSNNFVLCSLCKKLNQPIQSQSYENFEEWWWGGKSNNTCSLPKYFEKAIF